MVLQNLKVQLQESQESRKPNHQDHTVEKPLVQTHSDGSHNPYSGSYQQYGNKYGGNAESVLNEPVRYAVSQFTQPVGRRKSGVVNQLLVLGTGKDMGKQRQENAQRDTCQDESPHESHVVIMLGFFVGINIGIVLDTISEPAKGIAHEIVLAAGCYFLYFSIALFRSHFSVYFIKRLQI